MTTGEPRPIVDSTMESRMPWVPFAITDPAELSIAECMVNTSGCVKFAVAKLKTSNCRVVELLIGKIPDKSTLKTG